MNDKMDVLLVSARIAHSMAEHARAKFKDELSLDVVLTTSIMMASSAAIRYCPKASGDEAGDLFADIGLVIKKWVEKTQRKHAESN